MDTFGYTDEWTLASAPQIPTATASGYVERRRPVVEAKIKQRFAKERGPWRPELVRDRAAAEALRVIAEENDPSRHGYRYARLVLEGRVVPRDPALAYDYAFKAALVGNLDAMDLVAEMLHTGLGTERDPERAAAWEREVARLRSRHAAAASARTNVSFARRVGRRVRRVVARGTRTAPRTAASAD
jgi:TPR repeat protein